MTEIVAHGKTFTFESKDKIRAEYLEAVEWTERLPQEVTFQTREFSAVCPFSGLPDIAMLTVEYVPGEKLLELRSFKYYVTSFRNVGVYQEEATDIIAKELNQFLVPKWLKVTTVYNTRGGFDTVAIVEIGSKESALGRGVSVNVSNVATVQEPQ